MLEKRCDSVLNQPKSGSYAASGLFNRREVTVGTDQALSPRAASDVRSIEKEVTQKVLADGAIAIPYCVPKGANEFNSVNFRIMKNRAQKLTFFGDSTSTQPCVSPRELPYVGLTLIKEAEDNSQCSWKLYDVITDLSYQPDPNTTYTFVVMPDKSIRVANAVKGGHLILSNYALHVRYAGEIKFDEEGNIVTWNNHSGSYCPPAELAAQSGLEDDLGLFMPVDRASESNDCSVKSNHSTI